MEVSFMDLKIGDVIATLRHEKGITQEQFANAIGVSVPAVSKWETGQSYPDITLLPTIAEYFSISIDALMNFNIKETNQKYTEIIRQLDKYIVKNDIENGLMLAYEAVNKYPNDLLVLAKTALLLSGRGHSDLSPCKEKDLWDSISYYEAAIRVCKDKKLITSYKTSIARLYKDLGEYECAFKVFEELENGYAFAIDIADLKFKMGDVAEAKKLLQEKLMSDMFSFNQLCSNLIKCYEYENNHAMIIDTLKLQCSVYECMTGEVPNYYDDFLTTVYLDLAAIYMKNEDYDEMWASLEKAVYHATRFDTRPSYRHMDVKFYDEIKAGGVTVLTFCNNSKLILDKLQNDFSQFSEDERYKKFINELEKAVAEIKDMNTEMLGLANL